MSAEQHAALAEKAVAFFEQQRACRKQRDSLIQPFAAVTSPELSTIGQCQCYITAILGPHSDSE